MALAVNIKHHAALPDQSRRDTSSKLSLFKPSVELTKNPSLTLLVLVDKRRGTAKSAEPLEKLRMMTLRSPAALDDSDAGTMISTGVSRSVPLALTAVAPGQVTGHPRSPL